ncbi:uncharacterized protein LACBIDRAFT_332188 [Laccaria bicolor S238N-H82]|uniref:Predicted protein n=1 Tax=Laccaria bicolor (strain S238N-H82 / ATCC MYA-4686) TaxID=486041 RepID=B0DRV9_LACBS|nr:uncharacterized protein LACBIDRAFT_332188 [Laccaria bicolor S238N-H82]EDR02681.1 predicted protein [Laccaria bicolor S238N-H82]|eukprot:XP_001886725.1 predicted protein [Laccaria bicolor S238N-H82]
MTMTLLFKLILKHVPRLSQCSQVQVAYVGMLLLGYPETWLYASGLRSGRSSSWRRIVTVAGVETRSHPQRLPIGPTRRRPTHPPAYIQTNVALTLLHPSHSSYVGGESRRERYELGISSSKDVILPDWIQAGRGGSESPKYHMVLVREE